MLVDERSLPDVLRLASGAKAAGQQYIVVELVPRGPVARYINLWEGCFGEVIGRVYYDDPDNEPFNPDIPVRRSVKALRVRVGVIDVLEAGRRAAKNFDREIATPLRANKIQPSSGGSTAR